MATLLSGVTSNGAGAGASHSGPCTVVVPNDSVFDGAVVHIQIAIADSAADYAPVGRDGILTAPGAVAIDAQGTYFLRALVAKVGALTSLDCASNQ
jgi:hypothetical protein